MAAGGTIREIARAIDPKVTVTEIGTVEDLFTKTNPMGPSKFYALLLGVFAGLGLIVAAIGLYGVLSYSVGRRTQEIGIRLALGADVAGVRWLILRDALRPVAAGAVIGLVAAYWLSQFIASQLFRVTPHDPLTMGAAVLFLIVVCALAAYVPLRRGTRIDPVVALRAE